MIMPARDRQSPIDDTFFNDLSRQPIAEANIQERAAELPTNCTGTSREGDHAPKQKRIACVLCRKRKLRCDGQRPTCGTCKRLAHDCAYDEVRKKSGPKRGYVKALEARLQQVETLLKTQESTESSQNGQENSNVFTGDTSAQDPVANAPHSGSGLNVGVMDTSFLSQMAGGTGSPQDFPSMQHTGSMDTTSGSDPFSWEMIGLGLDEPLPNQEVIEDLTRIWFEKMQSSIPMIHRPRFLAALNLAPHMRPPVCLRYIMWCLAAASTEKYEALQEHFYYRARKYAQMDEMKGHGEVTTTLAHCQTWVLLCTYEFKSMYFPRAWMSAGRAVRLAQMMSLYKLDGAGLDVKQSLPPPKDWTEREERRRTFWMCYCIDRYASIGTGWPMSIDERDMMTNLPATEDAFEKSKPMASASLEQALGPMGASTLSGFAGVCVMASLFGRNLTHLHRPTSDEREADLNGNFWRRHREMDSILLNTALGLPDYLRLPAGISDPNAVFMNMNIHTSTICLHQAAVYKAEKNNMPEQISQESKIRCVTAAAEIASIMRMISHMDLTAMNPFISFCVYVAARVFVQYLKNRPQDTQMQSHLQFVLQAMRALKRKNPLTESFLVQLDLDLEGTGVLQGFGQNAHPVSYGSGSIPVNTDPVGCCPIVEIRESQSATAQMNTFNNSRLPPGTVPPPTGTEPRPGPPFTTAQTVNMESESSPFSYTSRERSSMQLPSRQKTPSESNTRQIHESRAPFVGGFMPSGKDPSDMDMSPDTTGEQASPSNSGNSQQGRSSHSSYSSPQEGMQNAAPQQQRYSLDPLSQRSSTGNIPISASSSNVNMFSVSDIPGTGDDFAELAAQFYSSTSGVAEWDMNNSGGMTGLTPMADNSWMLEGGGWEGFEPSHEQDVFGKRVNK